MDGDGRFHPRLGCRPGRDQREVETLDTVSSRARYPALRRCWLIFVLLLANQDCMVRTMRKRALPAIILAYASGAFSRGIVSIMAATPVSALNLSVASPVAGSPVRAPSIERFPNSRSVVETSTGSEEAPSAMILPRGRSPSLLAPPPFRRKL
jgi:hypothetical protein